MAGKAKGLEKTSNLERKMTVFGENKIEAVYNGRLAYNGKVLGFVEIKIDAELKIVMKLMKKKLLVFGENKISVKHNFIKYNSKVMRFVEFKIKAKLKNVQKQDIGRLDHNAKAEIDEGDMEGPKDMIELKDKKPLVFGKNKIKAEHNVINNNMFI